MQRNTCGLAACLVAALFFAAGNLRAEVSAEPNGSTTMVLVLGITEGPDPIPQVSWDPVRDVDADLFLNPDGGLTGDGRPDIATDPTTGWPHVVWAHHNGMDFDIAYSRWTGTAWLDPEFLTSSTDDEIDPRVFVDDTTIYVVWWTENPDTIYLSTQSTGGDAWSLSEQVGPSGEAGGRPSVVIWRGTCFVSGEEDNGQGARQIIVSSRQGQASFSPEIVASAMQPEPLDSILHSERGKLWMDWQHSDMTFAYSEFINDSWTTPTIVPLNSNSWVDREQTRQCIRNEVLSE